MKPDEIVTGNNRRPKKNNIKKNLKTLNKKTKLKLNIKNKEPNLLNSDIAVKDLMNLRLNETGFQWDGRD